MSVISWSDLTNGVASGDSSYNGTWLGGLDESPVTRGSARSIVEIDDGAIAVVKSNGSPNQSLKWRKEHE